MLQQTEKVNLYHVTKFSLNFTVTFRANVNSYHVAKFSLNMSFTVPCNYTEIDRFTPVLSIRVGFLSAHFLFWEFLNMNLTFAVNATLNLSNKKRISLKEKITGWLYGFFCTVDRSHVLPLPWPWKYTEHFDPACIIIRK